MKKKKTVFSNAVTRVFLFQFIILISLTLIDLYLLRGFYTSKIHFASNSWVSTETTSCYFSIDRKDKSKYTFYLKNNSLLPKYFLNYRNDEKFQEIPDSIISQYTRLNLSPNNGNEYSISFDCGTGLDFSSINPLESFSFEKSYEEIVEESCRIDLLEKTKFVNNLFGDLKFQRSAIDSILRLEKTIIDAKNDSIQVEYYLNLNSFLTKSNIHCISNKITVNTQDLLNEYNNK